MKHYRLILKEDVHNSSLEFRNKLLSLFSKAINLKCIPEDFYYSIRYFKKIPGNKPVRYKPDMYCLSTLSDIEYYDSIMSIATGKTTSGNCDTYDISIDKYTDYTGANKLSVIEDTYLVFNDGKSNIPNIFKVLNSLVSKFKTNLSPNIIKKLHTTEIIRACLVYFQKYYWKDKTVVYYPGVKNSVHDYMRISLVSNKYLNQYISFIRNMESQIKRYVDKGEYNRLDTEYDGLVDSNQYFYKVKKFTGDPKSILLFNMLENKNEI